MGLAVVLVLASVWMYGSSDDAIQGDVGMTMAAACVVAIVGAVMVARALMDRPPSA